MSSDPSAATRSGWPAHIAATPSSMTSLRWAAYENGHETASSPLIARTQLASCAPIPPSTRGSEAGTSAASAARSTPSGARKRGLVPYVSWIKSPRSPT